MSTSTVITGYCPICHQNVILKRQKMDFCIALMLLVFTAGIGLIFYYFAREKNRCSNCGSLCQFKMPNTSNNAHDETATEIKGVKIDHCPFCGIELMFGVQLTCPNCGSEIQP